MYAAGYYANGADGGSLGYNAPTSTNPALDSNAVNLGDSGTLATDSIALLTLNNSGAPGPRQVLHNLVVNSFNSNGTTTIGVGDDGTGNFSGNILLNKSVVLTGGTGGAANFSGTLTGSGGVIVSGTGIVNLSAADTYSGATTINQGTLSIATTGSITSPAITVGNGTTTGTLTFAPNAAGTLVRSVTALNVTSTGVVTVQAGTGRSVLIVNGSYSNTGKIDLFNNDMIIRGGGASALTAINSQLKSGLNLSGTLWQGVTGIESTTAATDPMHIMAIGAIQNNNGSGVPLYGTGGGIGGSFDSQTTLGINDILIKYTYFGDANLDGKVDGSDYARIDAGYLSHGTRTGWGNGDFNYDGVIDGSDYTLIDNAFNRQGGQISSAALIATETSQIATSASTVPEPTTLGLLGIGAIGLLSRHHKRHAGR
jgi:fibronectin-binding autotransporter adhesin